MSHSEIVELLLAANAEVDSKDRFGRTALSWAAEKGDAEVVKKLLAANADVDSNNWVGQTPLSFSVQEGHLEVVKLLLDAQAKFQRYSLLGLQITELLARELDESG